MLTCLVLVEDPPRCSECGHKKEPTVIKDKIDEFVYITNSNEFNINPLLDKYSKK